MATDQTPQIHTTKADTARSSSKSRRNGASKAEDNGTQVAHTLTACVRCRQRKTRCDPGLPKCSPCQKSAAICEYFDAARGKNMSRSYVVHLQDRVKDLELELARLTVTPSRAKHNIDSVGRGVSVKIKEGDEFPRFLGPSSGIAMTRLVLEMARDLWDAKSIREVITEQKARELKEKYQNESAKPTSKVYPLISFVAAPGLPTQELSEQLVRNYHLKSQYLYPVLHEPSFAQVVVNVYRGSVDPYENFATRLVIAISMQKLDSTYAGLADSYYLAALPFLDKVLLSKNLGTLQCLLLIALYSMTTPTRTAAYWVVGLATKLCQELRISDEATIGFDADGKVLDPLEVDMRRRCYWIGLSFELGLAHILGRPSSFAVSHDHVDVKPWLLVDDRYITRAGVEAGSPVSMKKRISSHFMLMRLLQLEIRHKLYVRRRETPVDDADPWFGDMERKMHAWMDSCPRNDEGSGISEVWFKVRLNTIIVFLFRPSPQVPEPSVKAAEKCFAAAKFNIYVQKQQIETHSIDITWIFGQSLFMAINTMLWTLSHSSIRKTHPKAEVEQHLQTALEGIYLVSLKWPGVESALDLYTTLAETCLKTYEADLDSGQQKSIQASHSAPQNHTQQREHAMIIDHSKVSNETRSPPTETTSSYLVNSEQYGSGSGPALAPTPPSHPVDMIRQSYSMTPSFGSSPTSSVDSFQYYPAPTSNPYNHQSPPSIQPAIPSLSDPQYGNSPGSHSPIHYTPNTAAPDQGAAFEHRSHANFNLGHHGYSNQESGYYNLLPMAMEGVLDRDVFYGNLGDHYAQLLHAEYFDPGQLEGLTLQQQSELLGSLEANGLGGQLRDHRTPSPGSALFTIDPFHEHI